MNLVIDPGTRKPFLHIVSYIFTLFWCFFLSCFRVQSMRYKISLKWSKILVGIWRKKKCGSICFRLIHNSNTSKNKMHSIFTYIIKLYIFFLKKKVEIEEKVRSRLEARNPQRSNCERSRTCSSCSNFCQQWKNRV